MPLRGAMHGSSVNAAPVLKSFSTTFSLTENPMVEDGGWTLGGTTGGDWTNPQTGGGDAYGTQNGTAFDDSNGHRNGYGPNQFAQGVIKKGTTSAIMEVAIMVRHLITNSVSPGHVGTGNNRGYELNLAHDGSYMQLVRWNGPLGLSFGDGAFDVLQNFGPVTAPVDGDILYVQIVGNIITPKINGVSVGTWDITTGSPANVWTTGNPGLDFYTTTSAANSQYGFHSWSCGEL